MSRSSVTSCGSGGGRFPRASAACRRRAGGLRMDGESTRGGGFHEARTLLRRGHESVDRRRVRDSGRRCRRCLPGALRPGSRLNAPLSRNANRMRRPRSTTPVSPVTPSRDRSCRGSFPRAASRGTRRPVCRSTGDRETVVERGELGSLSEGERGDEVPHVTRLPRSRPEPSFSAPSARGTPELLELGRGRGHAGRGRARASPPGPRAPW